MHVEMDVVDEEALTNGRVPVSKCIDIEPTGQSQLTQIFGTYLISSSITGQLFWAITSSLSVKIADMFQSVSAYSLGSSSAPA